MEFHKQAAKFNLVSGPNEWSNDIISLAYKQHPYLNKYNLQFNTEGTDNSGYLYGTIVVSPPQQVPEEAGTSPIGDRYKNQNGGKRIILPVLVENSKLFSFEVFIDSNGTFKPLTEKRVEEGLFINTPFQMAGPEDTVNQEEIQYNDTTASAPMLSKIGSIVGEIPASNLRSKIQFIKLSGLKYSQYKNIVDTLEEKIRLDEQVPDSIVLEKIAGKYRIHYSNSNNFDPSFVDMESWELKDVDSVLLKTAAKNGAVITSNSKEFNSNTKLASLEKVANETGYWSIRNSSSNENVEAFVFNNLLDFDGYKHSSQFVLTKLGHTITNNVVGTKLDKKFGNTLFNVPLSRASGFGLLKIGSDHTVPITILSLKNNKVTGVTEALFESDSMYNGTVRTSDRIHKMYKLADDTYLVPANTMFVPLNSKFDRSEYYTNQDVVSNYDTNLTFKLIEDQHGYTFSGPAVNALDSDKKENIKLASAKLVLAGLGFNELESINIVDDMDKLHIAKHAINKSTDKNLTFKFEKEASELIKVAGKLGIPQESIDTILSLGFITPESINNYLSHLEEITGVQSLLCELLIASRLGLREIPENELSSAIKNIEKILLGLQQLSIE